MFSSICKKDKQILSYLTAKQVPWREQSWKKKKFIVSNSGIIFKMNQESTRPATLET